MSCQSVPESVVQTYCNYCIDVINVFNVYFIPATFLHPCYNEQAINDDQRTVWLTIYGQYESVALARSNVKTFLFVCRRIVNVQWRHACSSVNIGAMSAAVLCVYPALSRAASSVHGVHCTVGLPQSNTAQRPGIKQWPVSNATFNSACGLQAKL